MENKFVIILIFQNFALSHVHFLLYIVVGLDTVLQCMTRRTIIEIIILPSESPRKETDIQSFLNAALQLWWVCSMQQTDEYLGREIIWQIASKGAFNSNRGAFETSTAGMYKWSSIIHSLFVYGKRQRLSTCQE